MVVACGMRHSGCIAPVLIFITLLPSNLPCHAAPSHRSLLQAPVTCPDDQVRVNNSCYCKPGTRDGTLVNPLMSCNGNNTLCPFNLWRGIPSTNYMSTQHVKYAFDGNIWSTFLARVALLVQWFQWR